MEIDRKQCPDFFLDYILYITVTKSLSSRTVQEYYLDIRLFLKYLRMMREPCSFRTSTTCSRFRSKICPYLLCNL